MNGKPLVNVVGGPVWRPRPAARGGLLARCIWPVLISALAARAEIELPWLSDPEPSKAAPAPAGADPQLPLVEELGVLELSTGERFRVRLEAYDPGAGVLGVRHPHVRGVVMFEASTVRRFVATPPRGEYPVFPGWLLTIAGGDVVRAVDWSLDERHVRLLHPYAGSLSWPRSALAAAVVGTGSPILYEGPSVGEEWVEPQGPRVLDAPMLSLARNVRVGTTLRTLPRKMRMDFRVSIPPMHDFTVFCYLREAELRGEIRGDAYRFQILGSPPEQQVVLSRFDRGGQWRDLGRIPGPFGSDWQRSMAGFRLSLFFDLDAQRVWMCVDGRPMAEWKDDGRSFRDPGRAVAFASAAPVTVTDLRVMLWDGRAESMEEPEPSEDVAQVWFVARDRLKGDVVDVEQGTLRLRTQFGVLSTSLSEVQRIVFPVEAAGTAAPEGGGVRVDLLDGSRFVLLNARIEEGWILGQVRGGGRVRIPVRAATMIVWLPPGEPVVAPPGAGEVDLSAGRGGADPAPEASGPAANAGDMGP